MHGQFTLGEIEYRASDGGWYSALSPGGSFLVAGEKEPTPLGFWIASGDGESKETAYKLGLYYEYPLWVGDTKVTSANAASITGSDPAVASYDAKSNTLTLDGATIDGDVAGCTTNGNGQYGTIRAELNNLTINVVADSTVTGPSEGSKPYSYGIMAKDCDLTIAGEGTLTASGGSYGYNAGVLANNLVIDGKLSVTGVEPTGQPSSVSCGVDAKTSIIVNEGAELTATGFGSRGMAFYDNDATLSSAISGTGWTNAEGTQGKETIASGDYSLTSDMKDFKKVQFPEVVVTFSVTLSGGRNAHSAGGNTEQTVEEGVAIDPVTFTASDGYHFEDFKAIESNGVTARLEGGKVVVSGTPTADVSITIPDAVVDSTPEPTPTKPAKKSIAKAKVALAKDEFIYDGEAKKPKVASVVLGGQKLKAGRDFTVSYRDNRKPGTATVVVAGKGAYIDEASASFAIVLGKVRKVTVGHPDTLSMDVEWRAVKGAKRYELQWRQKGGKWETAEAKGVSTAVPRLKAGKLYQFRVRAVAGDSKGAWSKISKRYFAKVASAKAASKKEGVVTVTWTADKKANAGYAIFVTGAKSGRLLAKVTVGAGKTRASIKGLPSGKRVCVQVRPLRASGSTVYSGVKHTTGALRVK